MIRLENVTKRYTIPASDTDTVLTWLLRTVHGDNIDAINAVDDVTLTLEKGTTTGLVGENGSGKTTLMKLISGITPPTEGSIRVDGNVASVLDLKIGFHPDLTGEENCYLYGALLDTPRTTIRDRLDDIFTMAGVERFRHTKIKKYSSGMTARLAFAVMVHVDPDVLVLDEIFAVGDKEFRPLCHEAMHEFKEAGKTIILASHDLELIESFCDRAICLEEGRVVCDDEPEIAVEHYKTL